MVGLSPQMAGFIRQTSHSLPRRRRQTAASAALGALLPLSAWACGGKGSKQARARHFRYSCIDGHERDDVACSQQPEPPGPQRIVVRGPSTRDPALPRRGPVGLVTVSARRNITPETLGNLVGSDGENR
jgi:hypothetical protein